MSGEPDRFAAIEQITEYLGNGGLWNPESMEHLKVMELLTQCRLELTAARERERVYREIVAAAGFPHCHKEPLPNCRMCKALAECTKMGKRSITSQSNKRRK